MITRHRACCLAWLAAAAWLPAAAQDAPIGWEASSPEEVCGSLAGSGREEDEPLPVLVPLAPEGLRDPALTGRLAECAERNRLRVVARLEPPLEWQRAADPYAAIGGWLADLDRFMQAASGRIRTFQLGRRPDASFQPEAYAFLVEKVATLARSIDPQAAVVMGPLGAQAGPWLDRLEPRRLGAYLGGLALEDPIDLSDWLPRLARAYPAMPVWLHAGGAHAGAPAFLRRLHEARAGRVRTVFLHVGAAPEARQVVLNLVRALPSRFVVDLDLSAEAAAAREAGDLALRFADPLGPEKAVILTGPSPGSIEVGPDPVRDVRAVDLASGAALAAWATAGPRQAGPWRLVMPSPPQGPVLLRYVVMKGLRATPETVGVTDRYELTAEEIIARARAFDASQARALSHYQAKATISYHYRAETLNESIDVATVNRFFWKDGAGEYEETELYVNGARWRGKAPSLPFIVPERVKEVPLEIRLDDSYSYRLEGRDTVGGRSAYLIGFDPVDPGRSLYSGKVWIDAETFARLRIRMLQHNLKEPITSNVDEIDYGAVGAREGGGEAAPRAGSWLPLRGYRQMIFTVLGRTVAVERRVAYEEFWINSPGFEERRAQAYDSGRPILREDEHGTSYLVKEAGGLRVRQAESLRNVAFFGGIGFNSGGGLSSPFGGMNYFDFDWRDTGTQIDIAYAGVLANVAWTDPALAGSPWELSLEGRFTGIGDRFRRTIDSGSVDEETLEVLEQSALVTLARPITSFSKAEARLEMTYANFDRGADTDPAFVLPPKAATALATARWRYTRAGYLLDLWVESGHRFGWDDWGPPDPNAPSGALVLTGGAADDTDFQRWGMALLKSFYPAKFQKVSAGASLFAGRGLDRFSRFRIGDFRNARVRGFNSRDVTFERGATGQIAYKLTLPRGIASVDLGVDGAVVENEEDFSSRQYLAGAGIGISFSGPWGTLINVGAVRRLGTSVDVSTGGVGFRVTMIRTFDRWPF